MNKSRKGKRSARARFAAREWAARAARRIAEKTRPERVILFGSQARGTAGPDSDVDLLVVLKEPRDRERRYALVDEAIGDHRWPVDLLVRSPEEIEARLRMGDPFFRKILSQGVSLHES